MDLMTGSATATYFGVYTHHPVGGYAHVVFPPNAIESNMFAAGGYYWSARLVRQKAYAGNPPNPCIFMSLHLWSRGVKVKASWELSVIDPLRGTLLPTTLYASPPQYFSAASEHTVWELDYVFLSDRCCWYVDDDGRLMLQITVTVVPEDDDNPETTIGKQIDDDLLPPPPSDMLDQLGEVLRTREGADVTFSVDGELFPAHKIVLAMRSRVFKAQLYGEMKETGAQPIEISGITADTFRALLRYIYTDSSPAISSNQQQQDGEEDSSPAISSNQRQQDGEEGSSQGNDKVWGPVWGLLMAADRYSVERLKLICEGILCKRLDVGNVAEMLALADRHHCGTLKDACIKFMTTSDRMGQVKKSQGYLQLRNSHPLLLVEVLEKSTKF